MMRRRWLVMVGIVSLSFLQAAERERASSCSPLFRLESADDINDEKGRDMFDRSPGYPLRRSFGSTNLHGQNCLTIAQILARVRTIKIGLGALTGTKRVKEIKKGPQDPFGLLLTQVAETEAALSLLVRTEKRERAPLSSISANSVFEQAGELAPDSVSLPVAVGWQRNGIAQAVAIEGDKIRAQFLSMLAHARPLVCNLSRITEDPGVCQAIVRKGLGVTNDGSSCYDLLLEVLAGASSEKKERTRVAITSASEYGTPLLSPASPVSAYPAAARDSIDLCHKQLGQPVCVSDDCQWWHDEKISQEVEEKMSRVKAQIKADALNMQSEREFAVLCQDAENAAVCARLVEVGLGAEQYARLCELAGQNDILSLKSDVGGDHYTWV